MLQFIWKNGKISNQLDFSVALCTPSMHYALMGFEGTRCYDAKAFKLEEHIERLIWSLSVIGYNCPYSVDNLINATNELIKANNLQDGYLRHFGWQNINQVTLSSPTSSNIADIAIACFDSFPSSLGKSIDKVAISMEFSDLVIPGQVCEITCAKIASNYPLRIVSLRKAKSNGYDDCLLMDSRGYVAEAIAANIFFVQNEVLLTPIADCFLSGITRKVVMELAQARGYKVISRHILPDEIKDFDECFLAGTAYEIVPVKCIGDINYDIGNVVIQLRDDFEQLVRSL